MIQRNDVPEVLLRLEGVKPEDVDLPDCRELMQKFQVLRQAKSPYADRVQAILREVYPRFKDQLAIK